jgi:hypothetical protein
MRDLGLPLKSGFYLTPNQVVTADGICMPMLGRTRDKYMYTLMAEPVDTDSYLPLDDGIAVMKTESVKDALEDGGVAYYTVDSVPLVHYDLFRDWDRDYILFAVRITDLHYDISKKQTVIPLERKLHFIEARFPTLEDEDPPKIPAELEPGTLAMDLKMINTAVKMNEKRQIKDPLYDDERADAIMQAIRRK